MASPAAATIQADRESMCNLLWRAPRGEHNVSGARSAAPNQAANAPIARRLSSCESVVSNLLSCRAAARGNQSIGQETASFPQDGEIST